MVVILYLALGLSNMKPLSIVISHSLSLSAPEMLDNSITLHAISHPKTTLLLHILMYEMLTDGKQW